MGKRIVEKKNELDTRIHKNETERKSPAKNETKGKEPDYKKRDERARLQEKGRMSPTTRKWTNEPDYKKRDE